MCETTSSRAGTFISTPCRCKASEPTLLKTSTIRRYARTMMPLALHSRILTASVGWRSGIARSALLRPLARAHHCPPGQQSPLDPDNQSKTGEQPAYGPIGVAAALHHSPNGESSPGTVLHATGTDIAAQIPHRLPHSSSTSSRSLTASRSSRAATADSDSRWRWRLSRRAREPCTVSICPRSLPTSGTRCTSTRRS